MSLLPTEIIRTTAMDRWTERDRTVALNTVWDVLHQYRENLIPPDRPDTSYDEEWDEICFAMAVIKESLE